MTSKQRYYNKEYERLISQAKAVYNELKLGGIFGEDTPSFEKILNYAGTKSGLKKPTKASLKALRRLQGVEGILWGVEKTLPKKQKELIEKARNLRETFSGMNEKVKKAKKKFQNARKTAEGQFYETGLDAVQTLLYQLKKLQVLFNDQQKYYGAIKQDWGRLKSDYYFDRLQDINDMVSDIESVITGGDTDKMNNLEIGSKNFFARYPGGLEPKQVYDDGEEDIENSHLYGAQDIINNATNGNNTPGSDEPETPETMKIYSDIGLDITDLF